MLLNWKQVDRDYVAKHNDVVYKLSYQDIGVYGRGKCYSLQAKKVSDIKFEYLNLSFVTKNDGYNAAGDYSYNSRLWNDRTEILEETEYWLKEMFYI